MPIQLPLKVQNVSTSLAACIFGIQAIRISLWTVQAISILAIFYAAKPHSFLACNGDFSETEKGMADLSSHPAHYDHAADLGTLIDLRVFLENRSTVFFPVNGFRLDRVRIATRHFGKWTS
jgi:hypothetical protein